MPGTKRRYLCGICVCILLSVCLFGCAAKAQPPETGVASAVSSGAADVPAQVGSTSSSGAASLPAQTDTANMVDERFEALSLIFRLAGREEYGDMYTEYQQNLAETFRGYEKHDAVTYAVGLPLGYDAVFKFAVHIRKEGEGFIFIEDTASLFDDGRWTQQTASDFLALLNAFYADTDFAAFYQSHIDFYEAETKLFMESTYAAIDLAWFAAYVDPANLRCIYSPASSRHNYGATVNDTIVYCAVTGDGGAIVHEYCHSFANALAHKWYTENPAFRKWCDDTVNPAIMPQYGNGNVIAGEYVTRAYNTLYYAEHGQSPLLLLLDEKGRGFPYIEDVYAMITPYEKAPAGEDMIAIALGVPYERGEEQTYTAGDREFRWNILSLEKPLAVQLRQTEVGNLFQSKTGDVVYVEDTAEEHPYLLIDLGETTYQGQSGYRSYFRLSLAE